MGILLTRSRTQVPPILLDCIRNAKEVQNYDLSCVGNIMTGAAAFGAAAWATLQQVLPNGILRQGYGTPCSTCSCAKDDNLPFELQG